ncbi:MAG: choice-of-anchor J domain-containing protein, partial [Hymenobacteraceae bacterium]|nr:choice-of-anchor J domain-containing protein [Hymenobacteraceae bacterium]MDX5396845.1 choice-of-anchor J domain-containing protein [Hymenobacteraceae bacterium]MDX5512916.1 choice-of-anchor J domain-containing protein [Hymenobacteraceae bacterium]
MKKVLLLKLLMLVCVMAFGQASSYSVQYFPNAGYPGSARPSSSSTTETTGWTNILGTTSSTFSANQWSTGQAIPFAFNFYGQPVTHFKTSLNMLVTFDTLTALLPNANDNLPSANLPNRTIAAFWDEFTNTPPTGSGDRVMTKVFGTAPNRQLWIVWYSFEYGNPSVSFAYTAAVLEETTNKIYVVDLYSSTIPALTTTVGVQLNNTTAVQFGGNTVPLDGNGSAVTAVDYYEFMPRILSPTDAALTALVSPTQGGCYGPSQNVVVTIRNAGTGPISNIPVTVTVSGATTQTLTATYTGTLAPGASANLTVGQLNMTASGTYTINASTNLAGDGDPNNNNFCPVTIINSTVSTFPHIQNFESATTGTPGTLPNGWTTTPATGFRWEVDNGGTSSSGTGPAVDHTLGTSAGKYVFTEASSGSLGSVAELESPCINLSGLTAPGLEFWYHMYGVNMGTLYVDIFNGTRWDSAVATFTGQQHASDVTPWSKARVNLMPYLGNTIRVRFRGVRGNGFEGDMAIDDVKIFSLPANDAGLVNFTSPLTTGCYGATEPVTVTITNQGSNPVTSVPVTVNVTGAVTQTLTGTFTGNIAPGATATFTVGQLNMNTAGVYNFRAVASMTGDGDPSNDTIRTSRTVIAPLTPSLPMVTFTGFTGSNLSTVFPGWTEANGVTPTGTTSNWLNNSDLGQTTGAVNLYTTSRREWIIGPKFVTGNNTHLLFKAAVSSWGTAGAPSNMGSDDSVRVMISDDCGATFKMVRALTVADTLTTTLRQFDIDLSGIPSGTQLIVGFYATDGPVDDSEDYYFHLDDIHIKEVAPIDASPMALNSPLTTGCYGATESVVVTLANTGTTALTSVPVTVRVTGAATQTFTGTFTGNLAPGATTNFTLPGSLNMTAGGTYNFTVYTHLSTDGDRGNDTIRTTRTVVPSLTPTLPTVTFNGFNGTNLSTVFPGWSEAAGVTPAGTTSLWANNSALGQTTAAVNLYTTSRREWIIGPKFTVGNNTHLLFKAAITAFSPAGAPSSMGSDDSVRVMLSDDCGATFKMVRAITAVDTLSTTLRQFDIDLSGIPAGTQLIVAFFATDGPTDDTQDYYFHLDDIQVKEVGADDVAVISLRTNKGCGLTATEQICITVQNTGSATQSNIPVNFRINNGTIVTETIAGPLAPNDTIRYCFTATANLATPGNYNVKVFTSLAADPIASNDTIARNVESLLSPSAPTVNNVTRCGPGTVALSATPQAGATINWYATQNAMSPVASGNTYSPFITNTTTFYVAASSGAVETVGKPSTAGSDGTNTGGGLIFNAQRPFILQSVVVYYAGTSAATVTINLQNSSSTTIQSATVTLPATNGTITPITVPLNFNVPAGTGMRLVQGTSVSLYRDYSTGSNNFPYVSPSGNVTITDGTLAGYYYFFYNWRIVEGCESARVAVTATVTPAAAINATAAQASICAGTSTTLSVSSPNTGYSYSWAPATGLSSTTGASVTATPTATTTYIVTATDGGCQNIDTVV